MTETDDRAKMLTSFLVEGARLPFVWGARDCSLWACDWIKAVVGVDPASSVRGTYDSKLSCAKILVREGGLRSLASRLADSAGLPEVTSPQAGDVGVVENTPLGSFLVVCAGRLWAWKTADGLLLSPASPSKIWGV